MHPVLLEFALFGRPFHIYAYGTMLSIAFVTGYLLAMNLFERDGFDHNKGLNLLIAGTVGALAGARLLYVLTNVSDFSADLPFSFFDFKDRDGMVAYGGYLGGFLTCYLGCRYRYGWGFLQVADNTAPYLASGLALTRVGCLLAGCDYGQVTALPWAIHFPAGSYAFNRHVREGLLAKTAAESLGVHPTQVYEILTGLTLCAILVWFHVRRRKYAGQTLALFLLGYGIARIFIETVRGDSGRGEVFAISTSQWAGLATVAWAIWVLWKKFPLVNYRPAPAPSRPGGGKKRKKKG